MPRAPLNIPYAIGTKVCSRCRIEKPLDQFYRDQSAVLGVISRCKDCCKATQYTSDERREYMRRYRAKRRGLTEEQINVKVCEICGQPETRLANGRVKALAIDHDHRADKYRGRLCDDCNLAIGRMHDDPALLRRAADYVEGGG